MWLPHLLLFEWQLSCRIPFRIAERLLTLGGGHIGLVRLNATDRDQRQAHVAHFREQSMQRGLVDNRPVDGGGAVAFVPEAQSVKPGGPAGCEVPFDGFS